MIEEPKLIIRASRFSLDSEKKCASVMHRTITEPPRAKAGAPPMVSPVDPEPPTEARVAKQVVVESVAMLTGDPASKVAKVP